MESLVEKIRQFNRFYLPHMNLLGNHYLGSEYSATEARIFFEIYENEGCNAAYIARRMNIDKSYLSRIIRGHEKNGYIRREKSAEDGRSQMLFLTDKGKNRAEEFIRKSNEEIGNIICGIPNEDKERLSEAIDIMMDILSNGRQRE